MTTMVKVAITKTCLHFRPRSSNHSASTGNGVSKAGLTKAATPQVVPHMIQSVKLLERANVIVSWSASPAIRSDNAASLISTPGKHPGRYAREVCNGDESKD